VAAQIGRSETCPTEAVRDVTSAGWLFRLIWQNDGMGSDQWIDKLAEETKQHDKQMLKEKEVRAHQREVIEQKAHTLWDSLVSAIGGDVRRFQQDFANDRRRALQFDKSSNDAVCVHRSEYPAIELDVHLDMANAEIEFAEKENGENVRRSGAFFVEADAKDNLYLTQYGRNFVDMADVARVLLEPIFARLTA
jgi:hypothetical protein